MEEDKNKKDESVEQDEVSQEDYDKVVAEVTGKEPPKKTDETKDGAPSTDEPAQKEEKSDEPASAQSTPKTEPDKDEHHGSLESMQKSLKDTKAYATRLSQENAQFKKELEHIKEEFAKGKASASEVSEARLRLEDSQLKTDEQLTLKIKQLKEDYPDLTDEALDPIVKHANQTRQMFNDFKQSYEAKEKQREEQEKSRQFKAHYENVVIPAVKHEEGCDDFPKAIKEDFDRYLEWGKQQPEHMKFAALDSIDPVSIATAYRAYKAYLGGGEAAKAKEEDAKKKAAIRSNASALRGGGSPNPLENKEPPSEDDEEREYNEVAKKLYVKRSV